MSDIKMSNQENTNISIKTICPRCMQNKISLVNGTHYICNIETCIDENGNRTQFQLIVDKKIRFPYNIIYNGMSNQNFFRKPYLKIKTVGSTLELT